MARDDRTGDLFGADGPRKRAEIERKAFVRSVAADKAKATTAARLAHTHGPETSKRAARKIAGSLTEKQKAVDNYAAAANMHRGFTQKNLEVLGGRYATYRARCRELWVLGRMAPTGETRDGAEVWLHVNFWTKPLPPVPESRNEKLCRLATAVIEACAGHPFPMGSPIVPALTALRDEL